MGLEDKGLKGAGWVGPPPVDDLLPLWWRIKLLRGSLDDMIPEVGVGVELQLELHKEPKLELEQELGYSEYYEGGGCDEGGQTFW